MVKKNGPLGQEVPWTVPVGPGIPEAATNAFRATLDRAAREHEALMEPGKVLDERDRYRAALERIADEADVDDNQVSYLGCPGVPFCSVGSPFEASRHDEFCPRRVAYEALHPEGGSQ